MRIFLLFLTLAAFTASGVSAQDNALDPTLPKIEDVGTLAEDLEKKKKKHVYFEDDEEEHISSDPFGRSCSGDPYTPSS